MIYINDIYHANPASGTGSLLCRCCVVVLITTRFNYLFRKKKVIFQFFTLLFCLSVCFCLCFCEQDYSKTCGRLWTDFHEILWLDGIWPGIGYILGLICIQNPISHFLTFVTLSNITEMIGDPFPWNF